MKIIEEFSQENQMQENQEDEAMLADAYWAFAEAALTSGEDDSAATLLSLAALAYVKAKRIDRAAACAMNLGEWHKMTGNLEAALTAYTLAGDALRFGGTFNDRAASLLAFIAASGVAAKLKRSPPEPTQNKKGPSLARWRRLRLNVTSEAVKARKQKPWA